MNLKAEKASYRDGVKYKGKSLGADVFLLGHSMMSYFGITSNEVGLALGRCNWATERPGLAVKGREGTAEKVSVAVCRQKKNFDRSFYGVFVTITLQTQIKIENFPGVIDHQNLRPF